MHIDENGAKECSSIKETGIAYLETSALKQISSSLKAVHTPTKTDWNKECEESHCDIFYADDPDFENQNIRQQLAMKADILIEPDQEE